jgi:hypothetical protein
MKTDNFIKEFVEGAELHGLGGLGILWYEWPKPETQNQPSLSVSSGNNGGNLSGTRPPTSSESSMTQGGAAGSGGGPVLLPGQNAQYKYTFNGGVNAHGEGYGQLFPSTTH